MTDPTTTSYRKELGDGLVLRTAASERDVERVAEFNGTIHGPEVAAMTRGLFLYHPSTHREDLIFVEDEQSDQVVSSLCLIPWTWRYEDVTIPSGEMGIVGTLEDYRRQGLIRAQVALFKRRLAERGCLTSHIQGIPYYYRQFGYEYALPLEGGLRIEFRHVPAAPPPPQTQPPPPPPPKNHQQRKKKTGKLGKVKILSKTDTNNLKQLLKDYTIEEFLETFEEYEED